MDLLNFVKVYNVIPKKVCVNLLKKFKKVEYKPHQWQSGGSVIGSRDKEELKVYPLSEEEQKILVPFVTKALSTYTKDVFTENPILNLDEHTYTIVDVLSSFRLNKYDKKSNMAAHVDHIYTIFDGNEKGVPILSIVGLFNENYQGGEFKILNKNVKLKTGDVIIFPSNFMYPHGVNTITKGVRYSFVAWAY
jgi:hypothetical protein